MRNYIISKEAYEKGYEKGCELICIFISVSNEAARVAVSDAIRALQQEGLYKQKIKFWCKRTEAIYEKYESQILATFDERRQIMLDYLDSVEDLLRHDIDILNLSLKGVLDRTNEPQSMLKARLETARILLEHAVLTYKDVMDEVKHREGGGVINYAQIFHPACLDGAYRAWLNVTEHILKSNNIVDFNGDKNCQLAFRIIQDKLTNIKWVNEVGTMALSYNPELAKKYFTEEELRDMNLNVV